MSLASTLFVLPPLLQGAAIAVDEGHFHRRRGLGRWERIGHPIDTLSVVAGYAFLAIVPPTTSLRIVVYALIALGSTLLVTKDEWVHAEHCPPAEHWLHAVLFVLHPLVFIALGLVWPLLHGLPASFAADLGCTRAEARLLVFGQLGLTMAFLLFQIVYWNGPGSGVRSRPRASVQRASGGEGAR